MRVRNDGREHVAHSVPDGRGRFDAPRRAEEHSEHDVTGVTMAQDRFYFWRGYYDAMEYLSDEEAEEIYLKKSAVFSSCPKAKVMEGVKELQRKIKADGLKIVVVTGRNKKLFDEFESMIDRSYEENERNLESGKYDDFDDDQRYEDESITENRESNKFYAGNSGIKPTKLLYFVDNINEYMYIADLIVTKPGGLTVSEAIASALPMAIFSAYPGQEEDNAVYLERNNMAVRLPKKKSGQAVHDLLLNPDKLDFMKRACQQNYRENSAGRIIELAERLVKEYENIDKNVIYDSESKLDNVENIEQDFGFEFDLENDDEE